jgi:2-polyprenyl-3-methyl-5-hydroxy-6-metoxy-1,4-benzoquinol methylase
MNYKLLFPTYRNRYLFVKSRLKSFGNRRFGNVLNLGTGEGDYDPMISSKVERLVSCDINPKDVSFAQNLNKAFENIDYRIENALDLSFKANSFDLIISVDVMEHVGDPEQMVKEMSRVLKSNGLVFLTYPQTKFPFTYDPINRILSWFGSKKKISQGAYAFGHEYLVDMAKVEKWAAENNMEVLQNFGLSGYLVGAFEMYWTGIIQSIFKSNAKNLNDGKIEDHKLTMRPSLKAPGLVVLTDLFIRIDRILFTGKTYSVGRGMVLRKK